MRKEMHSSFHNDSVWAISRLRRSSMVGIPLCNDERAGLLSFTVQYFYSQIMSIDFALSIQSILWAIEMTIQADKSNIV